MTVENTDRKQSFAGGQSDLTYTFKVLPYKPEHVKVKTVLISTDEETDLTYGVDYTVDQEPDGVGGVVTVSPSFSTLYTYVVYRETELLQESDYDDYNSFPADTLENDIDRLIMIVQEISEELDRTLKYPISESGASLDLPAPAAGEYISWNDAANGLVNRALPDPSTLAKATAEEAQEATDDTAYMTAAKVKIEVENPGSVLIPLANLSDIPSASTLTVSSILEAVYPIGAVITLGVSTNPATLFGIGTWTQIEGMVIVGKASSGTFSTLNVTGGTESITLTAAQSGVPAHNHPIALNDGTPGAYPYVAAENPNAAVSYVVNNTTYGVRNNTAANAASAHSNLQPYIVKYVWERTA